MTGTGRTGRIGAGPRVSVIVPAHNEAERIGACLRSIAQAAWRYPGRVEVVVVADACTDATATIARSHGAHVVEIASRNVGRARAVGCQIATRHGTTNLWLAHTDADSRVPPHWLTRQLRYRAGGIDVIAGTVRVSGWGDWPRGMRSRYEHDYQAAARAGVRHVHGANLGVAANVYVALGGFPTIPVGEDRALHDAASSSGFTVGYPTDLVVRTSGRRHARVTAGGFHHFLTEMAAAHVAVTPNARLTKQAITPRTSRR